MHLAKLLIERGHLAMLLSEDSADKAKKRPRSRRHAPCFTEAMRLTPRPSSP